MSSKSKKQSRQEAIEAENVRRLSSRIDACPIDRDEFLSLVEFVGKNIIDSGHDHDSKYIEQWAKAQSIDIDKLKSFLSSEKINDDWDLAVSGDPFDLLGPTDTRLSWMPLDEEDLVSMLDWIDEQVQARGCSHNYALAREWLSDKAVDVSVTLMALMAKGGGCDCEIVLNVEPEYIYPDRA